MKTPALREALRPLNALAAASSEAFAEHAFDREQIASQRAALKAQMDKLAKAGNDLAELRPEYEMLNQREAQLKSERRYIVYDATIEKLGELLQACPRGVLQFRDELAGWFATLDRPGHESDRAFFLEAWNGNDGFTYDRVGRGTVRIQAACVSVLGGIQPGPLGRHLRAAESGGVGADGLMQRFQLLVYPDQSRDWRNVDRWPNSVARDRAHSLYKRLAHATPQEMGADPNPDIPFVRFDDEGQEFFDQWRYNLEKHLRGGEESEAMEGHLAKYRSLHPSLALLFQLADFGRGPVGLAAALRAALWCELLEAHARRVYGSASAGPVAAARLILAKIRARKLPSPFTKRDICRPEWAGLNDSALVEAGLQVLEQHGWLRTLSVPTGGRPREEIHIHPSLLGGR
jgi:putative DNA primase/helicase